jgi:hypothetical protein
VQRYFESPSNEEFLLYSEQLADKRPLPHYRLPRILVQQIFWNNRLSCSYSVPNEPHLYLNTVFSVSAPKGPFTLPSLLAFLNSRYVSSVYERYANRIFGDKFPKISKLDLARLPVLPEAQADLRHLHAAGEGLKSAWTGLRSHITRLLDLSLTIDPTSGLAGRLKSFWSMSRSEVLGLLSPFADTVGLRAAKEFADEWEAHAVRVHDTWTSILTHEATVDAVVRSASGLGASAYEAIVTRAPEPRIEDATLPR